MFSTKLISYFGTQQTPFYFYNMELLKATLENAIQSATKYNYTLHYAIKANANPRLLSVIKDTGMGADCVSGNEIKRALETGFSADKIVFAGVGKTDQEIIYGIKNNIFCFNCESTQELDVIEEIAKSMNKKVRIALRLNPNIDAKTHPNITTGLSINKFGIPYNELDYILNNIDRYQNLLIEGVHVHVGSQITDLSVFKNLCLFINQVQDMLEDRNISTQYINLGGGIGIDYQNPENQIPEFDSYLKVINENITIKKNQTIHLEPGRSIVGQSGILVTKVLYVKANSENHRTIIVDSGFTELLRPALYHANHKIVNLSSSSKNLKYDVAGPLCETSDYFAHEIELPETKRGDLIAICSTGAYGEVMTSRYNLRTEVNKLYSDAMRLKEPKKEILV